MLVGDVGWCWIGSWWVGGWWSVGGDGWWVDDNNVIRNNKQGKNSNNINNKIINFRRGILLITVPLSPGHAKI